MRVPCRAALTVMVMTVRNLVGRRCGTVGVPDHVNQYSNLPDRMSLVPFSERCYHFPGRVPRVACNPCLKQAADSAARLASKPWHPATGFDHGEIPRLGLKASLGMTALFAVPE
jgi:hypothetical protein